MLRRRLRLLIALRLNICELSLADPDPWVAKIHHAGAIFIGHYTSESLGDYCAGPNQCVANPQEVPVSHLRWVSMISKSGRALIKVSKAGAQTLGRIASTLAQGEGLPASCSRQNTA